MPKIYNFDNEIKKIEKITYPNNLNIKWVKNSSINDNKTCKILWINIKQFINNYNFGNLSNSKFNGLIKFWTKNNECYLAVISLSEDTFGIDNGRHRLMLASRYTEYVPVIVCYSTEKALNYFINKIKVMETPNEYNLTIYRDTDV